MTRPKRLAVELGALVAVTGLMVWMCSGATGPQHSHGLGPVDLGDGRAVRLWVQPHFGDPSSVWFEATRDGQPLGRPQGLGTARGEYVVTTYWTPDGATSCTAAVGERTLFVYVDWPSGDVWPSPDGDAKYELWMDRHRRLAAAHPDLPAGSVFEPGR